MAQSYTYVRCDTESDCSTETKPPLPGEGSARGSGALCERYRPVMSPGCGTSAKRPKKAIAYTAGRDRLIVGIYAVVTTLVGLAFIAAGRVSTESDSVRSEPRVVEPASVIDR